MGRKSLIERKAINCIIQDQLFNMHARFESKIHLRNVGLFLKIKLWRLINMVRRVF
jgi:hypothetical protein